MLVLKDRFRSYLRNSKSMNFSIFNHFENYLKYQLYIFLKVDYKNRLIEFNK